jgi:hypothetical protein
MIALFAVLILLWMMFLMYLQIADLEDRSFREAEVAYHIMGEKGGPTIIYDGHWRHRGWVRQGQLYNRRGERVSKMEDLR